MKFNGDASKIAERLRRVRLLALDVDGVLTSGALYYSDSGEEMKAFCVLDGQGIKLLQDNGVAVAIISGRNSLLLAHRAENLGISLLWQGCPDKLAALDELCNSNGLGYDEIAYAGDDLPDIQILKRVAVSFTVRNAHETVKQIADVETERSGGDGAVREIADFILQSQDKYAAAIARFL